MIAVTFLAGAIPRPVLGQSTWAGAGANANWSTSGNWSGGVPGNTSTVTFPDGVFPITTNVQGAVNSIVQSSMTILSLTYNNQTTNFNTTMIPVGVALTIGNGLSSGANDPASVNTIVAMTGGGSLFAGTNGTSTWTGQNGSGQGAASILDLSGLTNFTFNAGGAGGGVNFGTGSSGSSINVSLAAVSNVITATTFNIGNNNTRGTTVVNLGNGTNIINADTINMGFNKTAGTLQFLNGGGGSLTIASHTGTGRAAINISGQSNTGGTTANNNGNMLFSGGTVNILASTIAIGNRAGRAGGGSANGTLTFDNGIVDATTINMAINTAGGGPANGTINVAGSGALLRVGSGGLSLVNQAGASGNGTLTINGGTLICSNNIYKTTATGVGTISISSGTLIVAGSIGAVNGAPIDEFDISDSTLNIAVGASASVVVNNFNPTAAVQNNIIVNALPPITSIPAQLPIISYTTPLGNLDSFVLAAPLPGVYSGYLSNNVAGMSIDLVVTNGPVAKTVQWGGGINNLWDTSTLNWTNAGIAVAYNDVDSATFDDAANTSSVSITAPRAPYGLTVSNNVKNYTFTGAGRIGGPVNLVKEGTASLTLAESGGDSFSGGITISGGTVILDNTNSAISGGVTINSGTVLQIGINDGGGALPSGTVDNEGTLVINRATPILIGTAIPGLGGVTKTGNGTLSLSANNAFSGPTIVSGGTLALTNAGAIASSSEVDVTGAGLDTSGVSGSTTLSTLNLTNSTLSVKVGYQQTNLDVTTLNMGGVGNTINVRTLPPIAFYPATVALVQAVNPIVGYNFTLGTLPAGSPSYAGSISLSGDQTAVLLTLTAGPIGVRPSVTWSGADGLINGNTNWSDALNWQTPGVPAGSESVTFNNNATSGGSPFNAVGDGGSGIVTPGNINNFVDINLTNAALAYANTAGSFHNTQIGSGKTLALNGSLAVNGSAASVSILGSGATLKINNPANSTIISVQNNTAPTLDLSGLDTLTANANQLNVGYNSGSQATAVGGTLYLSKTNTFTSGSGFSGLGSSIVIGGASGTGTGQTAQLYLGRNNQIFTDGIVLGVGRALNNLLTFNPTFPNSSVVIRGITGPSSRVTLWSLGDSTVNLNNGTPSTGNVADFSAGTLDARVSTMTVGQGSQGNTAPAGGSFSGTFTMAAGTLDVTTLKIGATGGGANGNGIGIMNVTGGTLIANTIALASVGPSGGAAGTSGTLNLTNANLTVTNGITVGSATAGSTLTISGSTVKILGGNVGSLAGILTLNLEGCTLQLSVDGNAAQAHIVATTVTTNNLTTINIGAITNVSGPMQIPLISYTGGDDPFGALVLGSHPAGYSFSLVDNSGNLSVDLSVVPNATSKPYVSSVTRSGSTLTLQGTNGTASGQFVLIGSTNLALPYAQWTPMQTNNFAPDGTFNVSIPINPALSRQFLILSQ